MSDFKDQLIHGTIYIAIAKYSGIIIQIVISAILARLLTPADYGVIGIASVFIVFFSVLSNVGIGPAVIQRKDLTDNDLDNIFSFTCCLGFILSTFFFVSSWFIADFYDQDILSPVCKWLSLLILSSCVQTVSLNLLYKEKKFRFVAYQSLLVGTVCGLLAILAALAGWGVYALVCSQVASAVFSTMIYLIKHPRRLHFRIDIEPLKKIFTYSSFNFLASINNFFILNLDKLLIGKFIGPVGLGHYEKSYRLMFMPIQNITLVVEPVLHPLFSEIQNNYEEVAQKYLALLKRLGLVSFMISAFCFFSAKELILLLFGYQWVPAIEPFRIMSLSIGLQMLTMTTGALCNSVNATKLSFYGSLIAGIVMALSFVIALFEWGTIISVAYAFLISNIIAGLIGFALLFNHLHCSFIKFLGSLKVSLLWSLILAVGLWCADKYLSWVPILFLLTIKVAVFTILISMAARIVFDFNVVEFIVTKLKAIYGEK